MYIEKIDKIINNLVNNFADNEYNNDFFKTDYLDNKENEKKSLDIINSYIEKIDLSELKDSIQINDHLNDIFTFFETYLMVYIILYYFLKKSKKFLLNYINITEYFYDPELINNIIKLYDLSLEILNILNNKDENEEIINKNKNGYDFLNNYLNKEIINNLFFYNDGTINISKIIIILIFRFIYFLNDRLNISKILEYTESLNKEFMYINIYIHNPNDISFNNFEEILKNKNLTNDFWFFFKNIENYTSDKLYALDKIRYLLSSNILYPVIDDILLYHDDIEKYKSDEKNTKLNYIINKINKAQELYNNKKNKNIFNIPLFDTHRNIFINNEEDSKILNKASKIINKKDSKFNSNITLLQEYKKYPYVTYNFLNKNDHSFFYYINEEFKKNITGYRYIRIKNNNLISRRIKYTNRIIINGFIFKTNIANYNAYHITFVNKSKLLDIINNYINDQEINDVYCWIFDKELDKIEIKYFTSENLINLEFVLYDFYNSIINLMNDYIIKIIQKKIYSFDYVFLLIKKLENKIGIKIKDLSEIKKNLFQTKIIEKKNEIPTLNIIKLETPTIKKLKKYQKILLNRDEKISKNFINKKKINITCQHIIMWEKINKINNKSKKYSTSLYDFIQHFIVESTEKEYVCKSCGCYFNIQKYVSDGIFDRLTEKYITYNTYMDIPLEEIYEYKQYTNLIRSIDKIIEKIGLICGVNYLVGINNVNRTKRKNLIKNVLDILIEHNKYLKKNKINYKQYGISNSEIYVFTLDDNIFINLNNDQDKFRVEKKKNIISYIIFLILLDLNDFDISFLNTDKKFSNIHTFKLIYNKIYNDIKFNNDLYIKDYKILCYSLYIISSLISKYDNIWETDIPSNDKSKIPKITNIIIKTVLSIIIGIYNNNSDINIYTIIRTKLNDKLKNLYDNDDIYNFLIKKNKINKKNDNIIKIEYNFYWKNSYFKTFIKNKNRLINNYTVKSNITNCNDGKFHKWKIYKKTMKCNLCNLILSDIKNENNKNISKKYNNLILTNIIKKYCINNLILHDFLNDICLNCKIKKDHVYTEDDLNTLKKNLFSIKILKYDNTAQIIKFDNLKNTNNIENFIEFIKNIIKNEDISKINFYKDIYIINHNYNGYLLDSPYIIDNIQKEFNKFFNCDVYYYNITYNNNIIKMFYNYNTQIYLGYKEQNKNYIKISSINSLSIKYSLLTKIKYLGYNSFDKKINRISNLKNIIYKFQKIIYNIIYNKIYIIDNENYKYYNIILEFINKHIIKLKNTEITYNIFNNWYDKYTDDGNILLYYILNEFLILLNNNKYNYTKILLTFLIIEFIDIMFDLYNTDLLKKDLIIKRFYYILDSCTYIDNIDDYEMQKNNEDETEIYEDDDIGYNVIYDEDDEIEN